MAEAEFNLKTTHSKPFKVIEPKQRSKFINLKELIAYKDLLYFLILRDVTVLYKQTILGILWVVLNPLLMMLIFTVIFGKLANVPSDGIPYPIFAFAGILPMNVYFIQALTLSSNSLVQSSTIFTKVYFPRIFIPLTPILSKLVDFTIAISILIVLMVYYGISPNINMLYLPVLLFLMVFFAMALGFWFSALAVQYRDVRFALPFLGQVLMYTAPVVFPASLIQEKFGSTIYMVYGLYPMAGLVEGFRSAFLGRTPMPFDLLLLGTLSSVIIFVTGLGYFRKMEKHFADVA